MARTTPKIVLNWSRDIPFDRLTLSQSNVRRIKRSVSVPELAEDIARRGLLKSLNVRPVLDVDGQETGMFEVPAGGRRHQALAHLVKQKRLAKTAPVPCIVKAADDPVGLGPAAPSPPLWERGAKRCLSRRRNSSNSSMPPGSVWSI